VSSNLESLTCELIESQRPGEISARWRRRATCAQATYGRRRGRIRWRESRSVPRSRIRHRSRAKCGRRARGGGPYDL